MWLAAASGSAFPSIAYAAPIATSPTTNEWTMSPKSINPDTARGAKGSAPAGCTSTLWSFASPWITAERSRGRSGAARASNAARHRSTRARPWAWETWSRFSWTMALPRRRSHLSARCAAGWVKSANAASSRPSMSPRSRS